MDRKQKIIGGLDLERMTGLEIGALYNPIVTRAEGDILYVDHVDTLALKAKYEDDPHVDVSKIVDVDGVWGANSLSEAIGGRKVDYVLASHVVEHVPDLVGWLIEIAAVLTERGTLRLVVPDRRFTFDLLRTETSLADVLNAHIAKARAPLPTQIMDQVAEAVFVDPVAAWAEALDASSLVRSHDDAAALALGREVLNRGTYHDVHCWVFTPRSFAELMSRTAAMGLHPFACSSFHDTERNLIEFHVAMTKTDDSAEAVRSWARMTGEAADLPDLRRRAALSRMPSSAPPAWDGKDRRQKILDGLDLPRISGLEIGPLFSPIVTPSDGPILYVDHADTETLRGKFKDDPNVDVSQIVDVDGVWGSNSLTEAIGNRKVDYVVASHVVEHVPDLIGWLNEIAAVLTEHGDLRLAVPDRRFSFDVLRQETRLADILNAYLRRARTPLATQIIDHVAEFTPVDIQAAWDGTTDLQLLTPANNAEGAYRLAQDALVTGDYHDVHCWVFTPAAFAGLMGRTASLGLHPFACRGFHDTAPGTLEFHVAMTLSTDPVAAADSWRTMARAARHLPHLKAAPAVLDAGSPPIVSLSARVAALQSERDAAVDRIAVLESERDAAAARIVALENSTSWRLLAPIRSAVEILRR